MQHVYLSVSSTQLFKQTYAFDWYYSLLYVFPREHLLTLDSARTDFAALNFDELLRPFICDGDDSSTNESLLLTRSSLCLRGSVTEKNGTKVKFRVGDSIRRILEIDNSSISVEPVWSCPNPNQTG